MRDPNRIDSFCKELAELWKKQPDMRFGQLMCNILGEVNTTHGDPFFPEDAEMLKYMKEIKWLQ